jgi:uncharacterized phage protein gp47/JayE
VFEDITYETILRRMIDKVEEWAREHKTTVDTREGSLIRTALSPAAVELQQMYISLDEILNESFADTATRNFLIRICAERGIPVEPATHAIRQGEFTPPELEIPIGSRFSLNALNYITVEKDSDGIYRMRCETAGFAGNTESGALIPIEHIEGLQTAALTDVLIPGEDEESTEHLRQRYFDSFISQVYGGNIRDYVKKTMSLDGVGSVKVYPVWNGGGTVKEVIMSTDFQVPSTALIDAVQTAIDPVPNQGKGLGLAPIGHVVTIEGVESSEIDITMHLTFVQGWNWDSVKPYVEEAVDAYFYKLADEWDDVPWEVDPNATLIVRISQIETRILDLTGILDVQNVTLNGTAANLEIDPNNIPTRGTITNE